jgi:hypothetical protein
MKSTQRNIWTKLSSSQKLNIIGSALLLISLFLNWYSDKDIFRSGDTYSALSGPLYLVGFSMLVLAVGNIVLSLSRFLRVPVWKNWPESRVGKWQIAGGFSAMYMLLVINSVYFHPQFGLNILNKKSEIGVMMAMVATVMICIGGYLGYRLKLEKGEEIETTEADLAEMAPIPVEEKPERIHQGVEAPATAQTPVNSPVAAEEIATATSAETVQSATANQFSQRDPRGKTDYERSKLYENLRKTMIRDTMSPQQRKKERAKDTQINAFSANFGKGEKVATKTVSSGAKAEDLLKKAQTRTTPAAPDTAKKPQMYRMDL